MQRLSKKRFSREDIEVSIIREQEEKEGQIFNQTLILLQGFSIITVLIGTFGVFNNFTVDFMSRKKELAMYKSMVTDVSGYRRTTC